MAQIDLVIVEEAGNSARMEAGKIYSPTIRAENSEFLDYIQP